MADERASVGLRVPAPFQELHLLVQTGEIRFLDRDADDLVAVDPVAIGRRFGGSCTHEEAPQAGKTRLSP